MNEHKIYANAMIIDDSEMDSFLLKHILTSTNFSKNVISFLEPLKALEYFEMNQSDIEKIPDIVFLDINMPLMSGFDFLKAFTKFSFLVKNKSKFIIVSSSEEPKDIAQSKSFPGVINYLIKPIETKQLFSDAGF